MHTYNKKTSSQMMMMMMIVLIIVATCLTTIHSVKMAPPAVGKKNSTNITVIGAANTDACSDDHKKFCGPKVGIALDACMKEHYKELSQACIKAEFQHFKKESKNERQNPLMKSKCAADINRFCKAFPGDMVTCLGGKMALLSKPCRLIVELEKRTRRVDIRLNGGLFGACAADIGKHCKNLPPGRGAILSCLKEKQRDTNIALDTGCQKLLTKDIRKASKDANVSKYIYSCLRLADYLTCPPNLKKTAPLVPH